jgi:hypothetical protein
VDSTDPRPTCGFCEGSGVWVDQDGAPDPCPLCDGAGLAPPAPAPDAQPVRAEMPAMARAEALLHELTPAERQRLYEELHARFDCRIYRR